MRRSTFIFGGMATAGFAAAPVAERPVLKLSAGALGHDIDPYRDPELGVDELAWLYADGLTGWNGGLVPLLTTRLPDVSDGGTLYRYSLRDVAWHDGRPLRARDVADAFEHVRTTPWGTRDPYTRVRDVRVDGPRDFTVKLDAPHRPFAASFFGPVGSPAVPLIRHGDAATPLGTGPFAVRRRLDFARWSLVRWQGSPRGTGTLGGIDVTLLGAALTANVQLLSGEADIALPLAPDLVGAERFTQIRRVTSTAVLIINAEGLLRTAALRHAFAAVAGVPALQHVYDRRRTSVLASLLMDGANDRALAAALEYRPQRAPALEGLTRDRELVLTYVGGSPAHERTMTLLQQNLAAAGVHAMLRPYPIALYTGSAGPLRTGAFDVAFNGLVYGPDADLAADWSCANRPPHGGNYARWCDPDFDRAVARDSAGDALRILYDALPCVPLSHSYENIGVGRRVGGFSLAGPSVPATYLCARWSLAP